DLRPATVVQADVEHAVRVVGGARHGLVDALSHAGRQLVTAAADHDAHAAAVHLVNLALHRLVEEAHQSAHLCARSRPVLRGEGVDGERVDSEVLARMEHALDRADALAVAEAGGSAPSAGPAAAAGHDDADLTGRVRARGLSKGFRPGGCRASAPPSLST